MAKIDELLKAKNPITGSTTKLTDPIRIGQMVLGAALLFGVFAAGKWLMNRISAKASPAKNQLEDLFV